MRRTKTHCPSCHSRLTLCKLYDVNGNRHIWRWCEPCYKAVQTCPADERPPNLDPDSLPLYVTLRERNKQRHPVRYQNKQKKKADRAREKAAQFIANEKTLR